VRRDGPEVPLPAELTQTVALVLHELATNAAKHGALSVPEGTLAVRWRLAAAGRLEIDWEETTPRVEPIADRRQGFGTTLLGRIVESQLGGSIEQTFTDTGLRCRMAFSLAGERQDAPSARRPGRGRILIAEDEAIIAIDLESTLGELGYGVFALCSSLAEGMAATEEDTPDLAILDKNLRGQSSIPLAERLHARGVPVIFATGYQALSDLPPSLAHAPRLAKPIDSQALAAAVEQALDGKTGQDMPGEQVDRR
jgi:CheY-like chemotaxis protein